MPMAMITDALDLMHAIILQNLNINMSWWFLRDFETDYLEFFNSLNKN